ncbi:type 1 glutamine amidotransferase [Rhodococcus aetherivorans]|uniref:type 1 glutamine amidotransferase n=1 Tax=Rhodococcus aetherivorans TaxID=191292 RepID=UPI0002D219B2|nr:type 1 glutamine amidotransferase [Rhodococcus aetherivorans]CCW14450.1 glutamine amidotransferase class-I [Rhodococcus aetherivorans]
MKPLLVVAHVDDPDLTVLGDVVRDHGVPIRIVRPFRGDVLSAPDEAAAVICLGGKESADDPHDYLLRERDFLRTAAAGDVPTLGICLGSQLLALALGGTAVRGSDRAEVGFVDVTACGAGLDHPVDFTGTRFSFHWDTFQLPPDVTVLARSRDFVQAFAFRSAIGVQYHPESSVDGIAGLMAGEPDKVRAAGADPDEIRYKAPEFADPSRDHLADLVEHLLAPALCPSPGAGHEH